MIPVELFEMSSTADFFNLLLVLGAALCLLGIFYMLIGFFYIGTDFSGAMIVLRGIKGRLFGFFYLLLGLPVLAYAWGATREPSFAFYQWAAAYVTDANRFLWFGAWIAFVITLHLISFFVKEDME